MFLFVTLQIKLPPGLRFKTYESPHFLIHYHKGTEVWVPRVVAVAESLYRRYSKTFEWSPEKINLVLVDAYDFSNGFSTPIFENTVYLYLQPPVGEPYFGSMEGWIEELLEHELVHTFHLDKPHPIRGKPYPEIVRKIFGRNPLMCAFPNLADPSWQTEGIATYYESKGGYGRLNNRYFRDQMLAYVRDGGRITPDLMTIPVDAWPFGRPYLWGSLYLRYVARKRGEKEVIKRVVNSSYFEDPITYCSCGCIPGPYLFRDIKDFYAWKREVSEEVKKLDVRTYRYLTATGNGKGYLSLSPTGRYAAYTESTPYEYPSLKVMDLTSKKVVRSVRALAVGSVSWQGDSIVLFSQYRVIRNFFVFSDIYALNVRTGKVLRLTEGERAHSPVSTPYGILYVRREGPRQSIVKLGGGTVLKGGEGEGFTDLNFYKDTLYFTFYHHGWTDVAFVPYGEDSVRFITHTKDPSLLSHVDSNGVYFTENFTPFLFKDGYFKALTDNPLSMLYPYPRGNSLFVLSMRGRGLDVAVVPKVEREVSLPTDFRKEIAIAPLDLSRSRPYNPLPHLLPKFWHPLFETFADPFTNTTSYSGGVLTAGSDILYRHFYSFIYVGGMTFEKSFPQDTSFFHNVSFDYTYDALRPTFSIGTRFGVITGTDMNLRDYSVEVEPSVLYPFNHIDGREYVSLSAFSHLLPDTVVWSIGVGAGVSRAYAYKSTTSLVADGFSLNGSVYYSGKPGYEVSGTFAFRKWLLFNLNLHAFVSPYVRSVSPYIYPQGLIFADTFAMLSLEVYPDVFSPHFPDINVSIIPPSPWAFFSYFALSRVYPGVLVEYLRYSGNSTLPIRTDLPHVYAVVVMDFVVASSFPFSLRIGYEVYPDRGLIITGR